MKIFKDLNENHNLSIALGYFDGVHLGHQAVLKKAVDFAKKNNTKSAVITFSDHPCCYLRGVCPKYILTRSERRKKIEEIGIDYLYELDFEKISKLSADEYLKNVLIENFKPASISTGWNHSFGCNKSGNTKLLSENAKKYGYEYFELPPEKYDGEIISSTAIRECLSNGKIETANKMMGYKFSITGNVIRGRQLGRKIGFKTANINYPSELILLPFGVYSVEVLLKNNKYHGIANFGKRPTINAEEVLLETHIYDFDEDIYGENITVKFGKMLRTEKKFKSLEELKQQIKLDISTEK